MRAGFAKSKVSQQANRLIERHDTTYGAYWKSYDFRAGGVNSRLTQYPLGPVFHGNTYNDDLAFHQAGGEIIFNLPNGLQAYMLVNGKDERIDAGPIDVVSDSQKTSGTPAIVNGLSCIACHNKGMITEFTDEIREGSAVGGAAQLKVQKLFPKPEELAKMTQEDTRMFLGADRQAMGPFLQVGKDVQRPIETFDEPIGKIARYYRNDDLDATGAAAELGMDSAQRLIGAIEGNPTLRGYGLGPLTQEGGHVKRGDWEKIEGTSVMQRTARALERGTPLRQSVAGFPCQPPAQ
jgi:serine/threonine-protein kinase